MIEIHDSDLRKPQWFGSASRQELDHAPHWPLLAFAVQKLYPVIVATVIVPIASDQLAIPEDPIAVLPGFASPLVLFNHVHDAPS